MARVLDDLTPEQLDGRTEPLPEPGYPPRDRYPVRDCLLTILSDEWHHRQFAERHLAASKPTGPIATAAPDAAG